MLLSALRRIDALLDDQLAAVRRMIAAPGDITLDDIMALKLTPYLESVVASARDLATPEDQYVSDKKQLWTELLHPEIDSMLETAARETAPPDLQAILHCILLCHTVVGITQTVAYRYIDYGPNDWETHQIHTKSYEVYDADQYVARLNLLRTPLKPPLRPLPKRIK
jgi:hypothetical protein